MKELTTEQAIDEARAALGIAHSLSAQAWRVERLDRETSNYFLVTFNQGGSTVAVATVDSVTGGVDSRARLAGERPHVAIDAADAVFRAGAREGSSARLVWRPSKASLSPLYPVWRIRTNRGIVYVDLQGNVWQQLEKAGPGA